MPHSAVGLGKHHAALNFSPSLISTSESHPSKLFCESRRADESHPEMSRVSNAEQPLNMPFMLLTEEVSQPERSRDAFELKMTKEEFLQYVMGPWSTEK